MVVLWLKIIIWAKESHLDLELALLGVFLAQNSHLRPILRVKLLKNLFLWLEPSELLPKLMIKGFFQKLRFLGLQCRFDVKTAIRDNFMQKWRVEAYFACKNAIQARFYGWILRICYLSYDKGFEFEVPPLARPTFG